LESIWKYYIVEIFIKLVCHEKYAIFLVIYVEKNNQ